ncbi:MAG TPA: SDR family oxidoreductase [Candidatus Acidoferrales bacterium]|jgi:2-deoxy-D-gluconate 3-dehydrogenase|nr:SDR family oxidoreductase [Candidatus Acidoferrales bacterium]
MANQSIAGMLPSFRLDGRLAIVTGASDGIGRAIAEAYAASGAEVVLVSRRRVELENVQRAIESKGGQAHVISADISDLHDVRALETDVSPVIAGRRLAMILVNCAGFGFTKAALDTTEEDWDNLLDLHAKGAFFCSQVFVRKMIEYGYGKIINLSSTWSASTESGKSVYGIAKAAVSYMTAALSTEWAPLGVRVNAIAPTTTATESTLRNLQAQEGRAEKLLSRIKLGRFAQPSDIVGAAIFLASPASDFITGQTLFVDGGWNAGR